MSGPLQRNIPQPGDLISVSQGDLLNNSEYWVDSLGKDHQIVNGHNSGSFEGGHLQVSLLDQGNTNFGSPSFPVSGADIMLWSTAGALYWRNHSVPTGVQMTRNFSPLVASNGYTFMAGGIILQWGVVTKNFSADSTVGTETFVTDGNIDFPNNLFIITGNPLISFSHFPGSQASVNIRASSLGVGPVTSFDWQFFTNSGDYKGFTWFAIGN